MDLQSTPIRVVRYAGLVEGVSTLLLFFVAMPLKYFAGMPEAVSIVGMTHGVLFLAYVGSLAYAWAMAGLPSPWAIGGVLAAILPFGPFVHEAKLRSRFSGPQAPPTRPSPEPIA